MEAFNLNGLVKYVGRVFSNDRIDYEGVVIFEVDSIDEARTEALRHCQKAAAHIPISSWVGLDEFDGWRVSFGPSIFAARESWVPASQEAGSTRLTRVWRPSFKVKWMDRRGRPRCAGHVLQSMEQSINMGTQTVDTVLDSLMAAVTSKNATVFGEQRKWEEPAEVPDSAPGADIWRAVAFGYSHEHALTVGNRDGATRVRINATLRGDTVVELSSSSTFSLDLKPDSMISYLTTRLTETL